MFKKMNLRFLYTVALWWRGNMMEMAEIRGNSIPALLGVTVFPSTLDVSGVLKLLYCVTYKQYLIL